MTDPYERFKKKPVELLPYNIRSNNYLQTFCSRLEQLSSLLHNIDDNNFDEIKNLRDSLPFIDEFILKFSGSTISALIIDSIDNRFISSDQKQISPSNVPTISEKPLSTDCNL